MNILCRLFFTACKAEIYHFPYSLGRHVKDYLYMITTEKAKMKNSNNNNNYDIFYFFLEYQQANEQQEEQEVEIAYT